ncbi:response regulator [Desulfocucumis palustris]|uniref:Stage 0 sporulation protein A homolog n=1 Tax=Desulfocucumis palustris TaxID=1898651 RepID=A0A2L2X7Q8_9FIRM|nr:ANTAR domain-containing protein [Desulfocucumis palustris]GBF32229.1 response regulator [Desulfocucumis palustris]
MAEQRIVLVDSDDAFRKNIKSVLVKLGYWVVGETGDGLSALKMVRARQPDLLIIEAGLAGMDGLEVAKILHEDKLAPVVVVASKFTQSILERAKECRVSALLLKPLDEITLTSAVELAMANYQEVVDLENKVKELKEAIETRKIIERAKGILMESMGLSEGEAFKRMQKQSMNKRISMRQVAEAVILAQNLKA